MKITSISRKISGYNYDNIAITADVEEGEDLIKSAVDLDNLLLKQLQAISEKDEEVRIARREKEEAVGTLERALQIAKDQDIPF